MKDLCGWTRGRRSADCPRRDSATSSETGSFFLQMSGELAVGVSAMRAPILLLRRHFRERLLRPVRLEPGVPSEMLIAPGLHQNLARALAEKDPPFAAIPVRDATLRSCGAIVQRIRNGGQSFSACCFEQPANIRPREIAELVEAER